MKKTLKQISLCTILLLALAMFFACGTTSGNPGSNGSDSTSNESNNAQTHEHVIIIDEAIAPTCSSSGLTEGKHCSICNEILVKQKQIPALGHNFVSGVCSRCGFTDIETTNLKFFSFDLLNDETYAIKANDDFKNFLPNTVKIPSTYNNKAVTKIAENAFVNCTTLTNFYISKNITTIGNSAFQGCSSLTRIIIPSSVISIGEKAFSDCNKNLFNTVDNLVYVGNWVVGVENKSLDSVTFKSDTFGIASASFESCVSLTKIDIINGITSIGTLAFAGCNNLRIINIGSTVTNIESPIFIGYYRGILESINVNPDNTRYTSINNCLIDKTTKEIILGCKTSIIPTDESVETIGAYAFAFSDLTDIIIPDNIIKINMGAFRDCVTLSNVKIGNGVKVIEFGSFYCCNSLLSVTIGSGVNSIEEDAFSGCPTLYQIINKSNLTFSFGSSDYGNIAENTKVIIDKFGEKTFLDNYVLENDFLYQIESNNYILIAYLGNEKTITLPLKINNRDYLIYQFRGMMQHVIIPDGMTTINPSAFYESNLSNITIPNSVTSIGYRAFSACSGLTSITIPASVTSIGEFAFCDCSGLTSITIPNSVTSIGDWAFSYCSGLTSITIPASVTSIGSYAFDNCNSLTCINYLGDIESWCNIEFCHNNLIGSNPLSYIEKFLVNGEEVKDLVIPNTIKKIKNYAFYGYNKMRSVTIPNSVTNIGRQAFYGCKGLISITIPDSVTTIGEHAFEDCSSLEKVYFNGSAEQWQSIGISYNNSYLTNATRYYYSETKPTEEGNFWHYDENGNIEEW